MNEILFDVSENLLILLRSTYKYVELMNERKIIQIARKENNRAIYKLEVKNKSGGNRNL